MISKERWFKRVNEVINSISRTTQGISDTTSAKEKPKIIVNEGNQLIIQTSNNIRQALFFLWENQSISFQHAKEIQDFIDSLALIVSTGLLPPGQSLYRTWTTSYNQVHPSKIIEEYSQFCDWLLISINKNDPIATAAIVEKRLNGEIHPFSDGCGRTSTLLASFILLRHGINPAVYPSRKEYFERLNKLCDSEWIQYYRSFFNK